MDKTWECEAYAPDGSSAGALCFFADPGTRNCGSQAECSAAMAAARQVLFARIQAAAQDDPDMAYLAGEFTSPDQLLGGPGITPADRRTSHP